MSLSEARRSSTLRTAGTPLPDCWAASTVSAAVLAQDRNTVSAKAARRRAVAKAYRVSEVVR